MSGSETAAWLGKGFPGGWQYENTVYVCSCFRSADGGAGRHRSRSGNCLLVGCVLCYYGVSVRYSRASCPSTPPCFVLAVSGARFKLPSLSERVFAPTVAAAVGLLLRRSWDDSFVFPLLSVPPVFVPPYQLLGGYLYFHKAPNAQEFFEETRDKVSDLTAVHAERCLLRQRP